MRAMFEPCSPTGSTQPKIDVVDFRRVEVVAVADVAQHLRAKLQRRHFVQRAVLAPLPRGVRTVS